ncbi:urease accessory protein UreD [Vibrio alfacsensis]|uniref:Urease accessory protein UreD n=1 Tax=Vibrio alfacsensis TaxID=1074311 RepID=A0ABN5PKH4_9VIBR|nr:urease accessory protein UreD [Vibrio alfacsensis]AXY03156.1 urease accessory protein UreD [Vibrio alfacsensis]WQE78436.1 urease accessory protein UreD [Vibrio alfacsensis]
MSVFSSPISGWAAEIYLHYQMRRGVTRLTDRKQKGPLMVQRPFYPEKGISHTYLLHPPGGVVGGDALNVHICVDEQAHSLITTPGATKFYRSAGHSARQVQILDVKQNAILEWLPLENIFFPKANAVLDTQIKLHSTSRFIGWEMQCFGRPMLDELFTSGNVIGRTHIYVDERLVLAESLNIQDGIGNRAAAMREFPMMGSLYIYRGDEDLKAHFQTALSSVIASENDQMEFGITDVDGLLIVRILGYQTESIMSIFVHLWQMCREHWYGYVPETPRIWAT